MYIKPGSQVRLLARDEVPDSQLHELLTIPGVAESAQNYKLGQAFFPAADDPDFRWLVLPRKYRWADMSEGQVRQGLFYFKYDSHWEGQHRLVEDPGGAIGAILLLSKTWSGPQGLLPWVSKMALEFSASPSVKKLVREKYPTSLKSGPPYNLPLADDFQDRQILIDGTVQIALIADILRAMLYHRELTVVVS